MIRSILLVFANLSVILIFAFLLILIKLQPFVIILLIITVSILVVIGSFASLLISKKVALFSVNGKVIKKPVNKTEYWLLNIIRIQAKKVNISIPKLAIYSTPDINAFATGTTKNMSLIAISTGLLKIMSKDEAEAVIAHEITHIANGDMVTMALLQGIINTFVIFLSRILAKSISYCIPINHNGNCNNYLLLYFIFSMIFKLIFVFFANIITLWFSRYCEFYADAGSAKLVGKEKMISALKCLKINCDTKINSNLTTFLIKKKNKKRLFNELFMSHPSLEKRIEALSIGTYLKKKL